MPADVRRRYERSLANLAPALRLAHGASVYDNSEGAPRKVLESRDGIIVWRADEEPRVGGASAGEDVGKL